MELMPYVYPRRKATEIKADGPYTFADMAKMLLTDNENDEPTGSKAKEKAS